ncbi:MAG: 3'(2'),5'-bisphosphate nucleotidase CysQ [Gammaproteobacteria bacterium]|nr:3'(2'),5'-bisphosphate nucleotidase CysQ [Gammaproteobacteria bacterium]
MNELNLEYLCINALDIARDAGRKIVEIYNSSYEIEEKDDKTPLTTADLAAHEIIVSSLKELTGDIPVLSEESDSVPFKIRKQWQRYWLVDPLDGTREFIKHNGEFSVNIALIENHQSILGVINAPVLKHDYFAWRDGGAYKQVSGEAKKPIHTRPLPEAITTVAGSRSHASDKLKAYLENMGEIELLSMGSSLKSCLVAEGAADIYPRLGLTSEWDTAAAQCIVEEAGGYMRQTDMQPMRYNTKDCLLNPEFFVFGDNSQDWTKYLK